MSPAQYVSVSLATCEGLCRFGEAWAALKGRKIYLLTISFTCSAHPQSTEMKQLIKQANRRHARPPAALSTLRSTSLTVCTVTSLLSHIVTHVLRSVKPYSCDRWRTYGTAVVQSCAQKQCHSRRARHRNARGSTYHTPSKFASGASSHNRVTNGGGFTLEQGRAPCTCACRSSRAGWLCPRPCPGRQSTRTRRCLGGLR